MAVKSKTKSKSKSTAGKASKKTVVVKPKAKKAVEKTKATASKKVVKAVSTSHADAKPASASPKLKKKVEFAEKPVEVTRTINLSNQIRQPVKPVVRKQSSSSGNSAPFNFMKAPRPEYAFEVGDTVEVFCDHEKGRDRVRGWIKGIVVQVDNKMVAVQFRSNVFLTDGWMVPDRILWYPLNSEHIRPGTTGKKPALKKDIIPDY